MPDQIRALIEDAENLGYYVPRHLIFFDLAVRGYKLQRAGLNALMGALRRKETKLLLLFATHRLFRRQARAFTFVEEVYRDLDIRCRYVKSGVDTNDPQWDMLFSMQTMVDQWSVRSTVANIQSAHQGQMDEGTVYGTLAYGYAPQPIPGSQTRRGRPRCRIAVDEETANVVRQIFRWYVEDGIPISVIAQRLTTNESIPLPPRTTNGEFSRQAVKGILQNKRYIGHWMYGVCEAKYLPGPDYVRQVKRESPLRIVDHQHLRIVPDELWLAAQERLAREGNRGGRRPKDGNRITRPLILNRFLFCPEHNQHLFVHGRGGKIMQCARCKCLLDKDRPLYSELNRKLALEKICEAISNRIRNDGDLVKTLIEAAEREAASLQKPDASELPQLRTELGRCDRRLKLLIKEFGTSSEDDSIVQEQLRELRDARRDLQARIAEVERLLKVTVDIPTEAEIRERIDALDRILCSAAASQNDDSAYLLRRAIELITGGRIDLYQMGERRRRGGWLQAKFKCRLLQYILPGISSNSQTGDDTSEIVIDFRRERPSKALAARAYELDKSGMLRKEIARHLGVSPAHVTGLLKQAFAERTEEFVDGRSRRELLGKKQVVPPTYVRIADDVHALMQQGLLLQEIADRLRVGRHLITKALQYWHTSRDLPVRDGRTRRKSLDRKTSATPNDGD